MRNRTTRVVALVIAIVGFALILSGCGGGDQVQPDAVGLKYSDGSIEGKEFDGVREPGSVDYWMMNDKIYQLPTSQRSYIIRRDDKADVNGVISVPSQDGTLIDFEISLAFKLNTRTDDIKDYEGGTARKFYEDLCRHYSCQLDGDGNSPDGWRLLLREKMFPQLESALKDEARKLSGDVIVNNVDGKLTKLQEDVGTAFQQYLNRQTGASFFCGPTFDRTVKSTGCPPVELVIISADYNNKDVRAAREGKKIAKDQADASETLRQPLSDPNYLEYLRIEASKICAQSAKAVCVFGDSPSVSVNPVR